LKGGVPLSDFVSTAQSITSNNSRTFSATTNPYIIGATAELRLPFGLGVEFDLLYRHLNYQQVFSSAGITSVLSNSQTTGNAWEFPLLAKYRFPSKIIRPFVDGGVAWDTLQGLSQDIQQTVAGVSSKTSGTPVELNKKTTTGFVLGAGVEIKALVIRISPEVRYTRWGAQHFLDPNGLLHSNQNQAEFLVGITF
jgi:opacity protein-like surface antigen